MSASQNAGKPCRKFENKVLLIATLLLLGAFFLRSCLMIPPVGRTAVIMAFGNPQISNSRWFRNNMVKFYWPPGYQHLGAQPYFYANRVIHEPLLLALEEIKQLGLNKKLNEFNGCYNNRRIRGRRSLSFHAFGAALDFNAKENGLGRKPQMHASIVAAFENQGFTWGGRWRRPDGMHFQYGRY